MNENMSIGEIESGDRPRETETAPAESSRAWNKPLLLAGVGLALMLGGYVAMTYVPSYAPRTPRQTEQEDRLAELRTMAARQSKDGSGSEALKDRLNHIEPPWRTPPYELPGRLAVYLGLFLFVAAGFQMYRHSPAANPAEQAEPRP